MFHGEFADRVAAVRARVPRVRTWLWVDDGSGDCPDWAHPYGEAVATHRGRTIPPWGRSPDDVYLVYTGGTTGMPKGVMWRQDDLFAILNASAPVRYPEEGGLEDVRRQLVKPGPSHIPCAPLMHGTGSFTSFAILSSGGSIVTLTGRHFSAVELLDTIEREGVRSLAIVGDAFAKPMLAALDAEPSRWDISSLRVITSSGVMFSTSSKDALLRHNPRLIIVDTLGSSEALGVGLVRVHQGGVGQDGGVHPRPEHPGHHRGGARRRARVGRGRPDGAAGPGAARLLQGRGEVGADLPGARRRAVVDPGRLRDGRGRRDAPPPRPRVAVHQHRRGEGVPGGGGGGHQDLRRRSSTRRASGVPDDRFGEAIVALVEIRPGSALDEAGLIAHVKEHLAGYKAPRRVVPVASLGRAPNGKVDYRALRTRAMGGST